MRQAEIVESLMKEGDRVLGHYGLPVLGNVHFADGGDTFPITAEEFERRVAELRARAAK